jgi:hypothetical protein
MKFHTQTKFGGKDHPEEERGDCFTACIASLVGVELSEIPNFCAYDDEWPSNCKEWLFERGIVRVVFSSYPIAESVAEEYKELVLIASGPGPRGHRHAVLWKNNDLLWDPHPSRDGLLKAEEFDMLVVFDGARLKRPDGELYHPLT